MHSEPLGDRTDNPARASPPASMADHDAHDDLLLAG